LTWGVGRQYIGEIGKTSNGVVAVTSHLSDGIKSLPLDIELYPKADSLPQAADPQLKKKPSIAAYLIDPSLSRGYQRQVGTPRAVSLGHGSAVSVLNRWGVWE
jgi:SRSO17 transposase